MCDLLLENNKCYEVTYYSSNVNDIENNTLSVEHDIS